MRKSALEDANMLAYFEEFPQFKTAVEQLALTQPQDAARVFVPNGDQIIEHAIAIPVDLQVDVRLGRERHLRSGRIGRGQTHLP